MDYALIEKNAKRRQIAYHAVLDAILRADVVHLVPFL